ncbi:fructosamine kinase family protein [Skermanella stibiiresistens]|uniref:fructosamine kinase family protein n=1 Tax=Skermanella stibiiresistens TaxID=913326 RepID=UPI0004AE9AB9|nr:fructosamine kinase family protein [Skermanella stibiiresistens]
MPAPQLPDGVGRVASARRLADGNAAELWLLDLVDGRRVVAKRGAGLAVEGRMLRHLADHSSLPVPELFHADDRLLVMSHVAADGGGLTTAAQEHAAELVAALHGIGAERYGFPYDTVIGPLPQPNPESDNWIAFFRDHRLLGMARRALDEKRIDNTLMAAIERLAGLLPDLIGEPALPSLIHGDLWGGNILVRDGRVAAFIDPAIHHADPEIELAFSTLFGTFGQPFFHRYGEIRPIRPGFFEVRRDLYNLYPLLVHVRLFGGGYRSQVARIVGRFT